jgi:alkylresorcinol/alkylpyrone synthase
MHPVPRLVALATAVPAYPLDQEAVVERAKRLFAGAPELDRLLPVFANSGIRRRYSAVPLDWFEELHGWPERNRRYLETALDLLESATGRALDRAGIAASQIGAIVVVSTTGIATPSLDALLIERMQLAPTVQRLPIFGSVLNAVKTQRLSLPPRKKSSLRRARPLSLSTRLRPITR